jgi:hypothetical protein
MELCALAILQGERQQHIAGHGAESRIAGIEEHQAIRHHQSRPATDLNDSNLRGHHEPRFENVIGHCTNPLRGNFVVTTVVSVHFRAL